MWHQRPPPSFWQAEGKWNRFHNVHITHLFEYLNQRLLPLGYAAEVEESLQIRRIGESSRYPRTDILIRDQHPDRPGCFPRMTQPVGVQVLTLDSVLDLEQDAEKPYTAIRIYQQTDDLEAGQPVAWLELLSPTNKGDGRDAESYLSKRESLLGHQLMFVELDYRHTTRSTFDHLPDYMHQQPGAHPYRIAVIDPRPTVRDGKVALAEFDVDEPLPRLRIPLNGADMIECDFGAVYAETLQRGSYGHDLDYSQLPTAFETYAPADQSRIFNRLVAVLTAARDGRSLEGDPLSVEVLPLDEARACFETLRGDKASGT